MNEHQAMNNAAQGLADNLQNSYQGNLNQSGSYGSSTGQNIPVNSVLNAPTILRIILHRWAMVAMLGIVGFLVGIFYLQNAIPIYEAVAELEMNVRRPKVINNDAVFEDPGAAHDTDVIFNTRFAKFKSPAMEKLAASEYIERYPDHLATKTGASINRYTLALWVRDAEWNKDPDANIVYVSYESDDPQFAAQLVNVLSHSAGMLMMQENRAQSDEAVKWLVSQAKEQRISLEEVEGQLADLRETLQLDSLQQRKAALAQALVTVSDEKEALISNLASRKSVFDFVSELKDSDPNLEMLPSGLPKEAELNALIRSWRASNDEMLRIADRYTAIHPEYKRAAEIEARSRDRLEQFIDLSAKAVQNELDLLENQIDLIDDRITKMKDEALTLEQLLAAGLQQLQSLERKRDAADNSYQSMLRRMEEARLSADENMAFAKIIRKASVPRVPERPVKSQVFIISLVLGLLLGCLIAVIIALWTDKVSSVADLKALNLNILATIPSQKKVDSRGELATIGLRDKFNPIVEIFAGINALISSGKYAGQTQAIIACSIGPGEGKTISACNMAISSAFNGSKTLLIDGDLRRPQLANIFNIDEEQPSLLEWLADPNGSDDFGQLISSGLVDNLDTITSRPHQNINPAELLGRDRLVNLIDWAREHYDRIIFDTPPLGPVGDAQVLANLADAVILVSRMGVTKRRALKFALSRFQEIDVPVVGCVANDVPHSLAGMFGGAEGYGCNYGYGSYKYDGSR
jgi:capsular exopolysaccharide synthesis family protein